MDIVVAKQRVFFFFSNNLQDFAEIFGAENLPIYYLSTLFFKVYIMLSAKKQVSREIVIRSIGQVHLSEIRTFYEFTMSLVKSSECKVQQLPTTQVMLWW